MFPVGWDYMLFLAMLKNRNNKSCHYGGSVLIMSLGMLLGPIALLHVDILIQVS